MSRFTLKNISLSKEAFVIMVHNIYLFSFQDGQVKAQIILPTFVSSSNLNYPPPFCIVTFGPKHLL